MSDMIQESFEKSEKIKTSFYLTIYLIENNANIAYPMHECDQ